MGRSVAKAIWRNIEVYAVVGIYYLVLVTLAAFLLHNSKNDCSCPGSSRAAERAVGIMLAFTES